MLRFAINNFLELRLENSHTNIYVKGKHINQCKFLLLNLDIDQIKSNYEINSIDEAVEKLDRSMEYYPNSTYLITPEEEFLGHCSNLHAWYENNYNSQLIHSNLAFPLLKELTKAGDFIAKKVFKEEIAKRFESGYLITIQYLLFNGYLDILNIEERDTVLNYLNSKFINKVLTKVIELIRFPLKFYKQLNNLFDVILFLDLKYNKNFFTEIFDKLPKIWRRKYTKSILLYLNYKELKNYSIPYGKFYTYFENLINYLKKRLTDFDEFLKILDSGYYNSPFSLDERLAYGAVKFNLL